MEIVSVFALLLLICFFAFLVWSHYDNAKKYRDYMSNRITFEFAPADDITALELHEIMTKGKVVQSFQYFHTHKDNKIEDLLSEGARRHLKPFKKE